MVRYIAAGILACLYAAGSIWLVQSQGRAYRDSLHRERLADQEDGATSPRPPEVSEAEAVPIVATPAPRSPEPTSTKPAEPATRPASPVATLAEAKPNPPNSPAMEPSPPPTPQPNPDPLWDQAEIKKSWDLDLARRDAREEVRLGRELNGLILQLNASLRDGPWLRRVQEVAEPLLEKRSRKEIEYTFTILDSDAVNAFSTPGGFVYVSRGLFNLIGEDEDYALEFVIGHEIAHVDSQHALKCLGDSGVMKLAGGTLQKLYLLIIPFAYPDAMEFKADSWAYSQMRQLECTDREAMAFLNKFKGFAEHHGFPYGREKLPSDGSLSPLDNHFRAHPDAHNRLKHLKELASKASNPPK